MYADRYGGGRRVDPASLGVAVAINGAVVAALMLASPSVTKKIFDPPITIYPVPIETPPPPEPTPPQPQQRAAPRERLDAPIAKVPTPVTTEFVTRTDPAPFPTVGDLPGTGMGGVAVDPPTPAPPALVGPSLDGRYAEDIQPGYPTEERRAEREGRVVVRVLVGVSGRVKQVERVEATSDAFYRVTERQALSRWRFNPATRGGIPVEAWYKLSLRFELKD